MGNVGQNLKTGGGGKQYGERGLHKKGEVTHTLPIMAISKREELIRLFISLLSSFLSLYAYKHLPRLSGCKYVGYICLASSES